MTASCSLLLVSQYGHEHLRGPCKLEVLPRVCELTPPTSPQIHPQIQVYGLSEGLSGWAFSTTCNRTVSSPFQPFRCSNSVDNLVLQEVVLAYGQRLQEVSPFTMPATAANALKSIWRKISRNRDVQQKIIFHSILKRIGQNSPHFRISGEQQRG
jgi:hypothetical protein